MRTVTMDGKIDFLYNTRYTYFYAWTSWVGKCEVPQFKVRVTIGGRATHYSIDLQSTRGISKEALNYQYSISITRVYNL